MIINVAVRLGLVTLTILPIEVQPTVPVIISRKKKLNDF